MVDVPTFSIQEKEIVEEEWEGGVIACDDLGVNLCRMFEDFECGNSVKEVIELHRSER